MTTTGSGDNGSWVPFGLETDEVATHTSLTPGVPSWLESSVWAWILDQLAVDTHDTEYGTLVLISTDGLLRLERTLRTPPVKLDAVWIHAVDAIPKFRRSFGRSETEVLRVVDYCASLLDSRSPQLAKLQQMLTEGGSAWTVGQRSGRPGLVHRVPEGVLAAAQDAFARGDAGKRLAAAWESAFGLEPDPEGAYSKAVKAVEDAAIPIVSPTAKNATLGTVISQIRSGGKFRLPHLREHADAKSHDVLLSMLQMLWTGQHDRHGGPSVVSVPNVTQDEAESAVILAVSLVGWFASGKVQP